jgi:uncharacterized RDD family membrane protein YckC
MTWFFVNAGQQAGPISDIQLDEYILGGKILPDTLIWREGMESWLPCKEARPAVAFKTRPAAMALVSPLAGNETSVEVVCSECGVLQPKDNAIKHGEVWICAACKPLHIQKIKEGVAAGRPAYALDYAGIGPRAVAKLLDGLIIGLPAIFLMAVIIAFLTPAIARNRASADGLIIVMIAGIAIVALAMMFFQIWCLPRWGATPGKRIMGLRVVTTDGGSISWGRAIGRFFGEWVNGLIPFWIGYLIAAFDNERRTVHDHIAGTRVIKV